MIDQVFEQEGGGFTSLSDLRGVRVLVGIPFHDESDSLPEVVLTAMHAARGFPAADRAAIVCVGPHQGAAVLERVSSACNLNDGIAVAGVLVENGYEGYGWMIRVLLEVADRLKSPLVLLAPDLVPQPQGGDEPGMGFAPYWIQKMADTVIELDQDLAIARANQHFLANAVESLFASAVIEGVFGVRLAQPLAPVCAFSYRLVRACLHEDDSWAEDVGKYGFNPWLTIQAVVGGLELCEVPLGTVEYQHEFGRLKPIFTQVAHVLCKQVSRHNAWWIARGAWLQQPRSLGSSLQVVPSAPLLQVRQLLHRFKLEFNHFNEVLFREMVPSGLRDKMQRMADEENEHIAVTADEWVDVMGKFFLGYGFDKEYHPDDIVDGLYPCFLARLITIVREMDQVNRYLIGIKDWGSEKQESILWHVSEGVRIEQAGIMAAGWETFGRSWQERTIQTSPYLPRLGAWEFVPHVGVMVPQELKKPDGGLVWANDVYKEQMDRYRGEFVGFVRKQLSIEDVDDSIYILKSVRRFMRSLNRVIDEQLFLHDLTSVSEAEGMVKQVFESFPVGESFQLTDAACQLVLKRIPPSRLLVQLGYSQIGELLGSLKPNDALAMAAWFDRQDYLDRVLDLIEEEADLDWFCWGEMKPMIVDSGLLKFNDEIQGSTSLTRLAGRVVMTNIQKGSGGEFPKLWFLLLLLKRIIGVELFSEAWSRFHEEEIDFPDRVVNSIKGHWGRRILSAHNAFENRHQRILVKRLRDYADRMQKEGSVPKEALGILEAAVSVYHLSATLPDTTFVPLSAWTWASYSRRGGLGDPTPLSSLVERDWATRDFLEGYLQRAGLGDSKTVDETILRLMTQGREPEDLGRIMLGMTTDFEELVVQQTPRFRPKPAAKLVRPVTGPILSPIAKHPWESRYVLNAAAVRLEGVVYIVYRAFGDDKISRLGLAWTRDGVNIEGRMDSPIFAPSQPSEASGCEDPRITLLDNRLYMLYTAYDGKVPQIALASISVGDFLSRRFDRWKRHGLGFPGLSNKDAALYPDKFEGKYAIYHRIDPNMWLSYLDDLSCPWPRTGYKIVVGPRSSMMWDGVKIGAGAQPLKTTLGWLNIYHGVDYQRCYRLGVLFMDLKDPSKVLYQSPNPILEPEQDFEIGEGRGGDFWVPRVVFSCGAVPRLDKQIIEPDDEILVYYGAADTAIGVAVGRLNELVPILGS